MSQLKKLLSTSRNQNKKENEKKHKQNMSRKNEMIQHQWNTKITDLLGYPPSSHEREIFQMYRKMTSPYL